MTDPRLVAQKAILAVDAGQHAQGALAAFMSDLAIADRGLCADLVYGTLRKRSEIRGILQGVLKKPGKLPAPMLVALELAAYAIFYQERVPAYAAVDQAVAQIKRGYGQKLANVANGALRNIIRKRESSDSLPADGAYGEIFELWRSAYGLESAQKILQRSKNRPYAAFRVNLTRKEGKDVLAFLKSLPDAEQVGYSGMAFPPGEAPALVVGRSLDYWLQKGVLTRQAAGSQEILAALSLGERWRGQPVWDACAGFGGKTAALLENGAHVKLSSDLAWKRLKCLPLECARLDLETPVTIQADAAKPPLAAWDGHIIADAPCSGLGVLARRPDLAMRWSRENTDRLVKSQAAILDKLASLLRPGRELAYITCSLNPAENETHMENLLGGRPDLELLAQWQTPHDAPWLEGMYGALMRKKQ